MDKLIGYLLLAGIVIGLVCLVVALVVAAAIIAGPCVLSCYWLRNRVRKFELSRMMVWHCVLLGIVLFWLPLLAILADTSVWPMALWTSSILGLAGPAFYLTIEAYRQVFWPHRKIAIADGATACRLGWSLWRRRHRLSRLEDAIRWEDERHGGLRRELQHVRALTREVILHTDPAFYSAEVVRWTRICATMTDDTLQQRVDVLPANAMVTTLERAIQRLPELASQSPGQVRAILQAAVTHAEVLRRAADGHDNSYEEDVREAKALRSEIDTLHSKFIAAQDNKIKAEETIRRLQKERIAVQ
jgi:hypothetical protein